MPSVIFDSHFLYKCPIRSELLGYRLDLLGTGFVSNPVFANLAVGSLIRTSIYSNRRPVCNGRDRQIFRIARSVLLSTENIAQIAMRISRDELEGSQNYRF